MQSNMTTNRMFVIKAKVLSANQEMEEKFLQSSVETTEKVWHNRFGHLNQSSLKMLVEKDMVRGMPQISMEEGVSEICMKGKQNRTNIPKQSTWRASRGLELVHSDICGPISPTSGSGKRYVINFIDDYSRKCWTVLLSEKSEAFKAFKDFKIAAEKEIGGVLVCLRTDRGGEFNSKEFEVFCAENGIKRQLTAAYTPQQNGVAERKNRSVMNMVRCMLFGMKVPLRFWPEAVQYAVHILNRSPTTILGDVTPVEKWSNLKPSVEHLRVFGCVAFALIPYERRVKLDEKSVRCVMFGVCKESKAYRLYVPATEKIIVSRDVIFDERESWNWEEKVEDDKFIIDFGDEEEERNDPGEIREETRENNEEAEPRAEEDNAIEVGGSQTQIASPEPSRRGTGRAVSKPVWMEDYECKLIEEEKEEMVAMFVEEDDPNKFEEAVEHEKWRKAMEAEIKSIEENNTWELVHLPAGAKVVGVKWVYKTKFNERGEVDKFKARLVAKGFHQTHGKSGN